MDKNYILLILCSFLIGSIPIGLIISKVFFGFDIRTKGSGNIGSTNVFRVLGTKWGIFTQIFDILKGFVPSFFLSVLFFPDSDSLTLIRIIAGMSAVLGHIFSPFIGFKGGKGVNTAVGMLLGVSAIDIGLAAIVFFAFVSTTGYISLGSITSSISLPIIVLSKRYIAGYEVESFSILLLFYALISLLIIYTHRSNIKRLLNNSENKFEKLHLFKLKK